MGSQTRFVVYESAATNLAPDDTNGVNDVFMDITVGGAVTIVRGHAVPSCAPFTACVPTAAGWWSTDLERWAALPADEAWSLLFILVSGEFGFLAIEGSMASSSLDGLSWSALTAPADDRVLILDGVAFKDRVIAVGERTSAEGPFEPWLMSGALTLQ